MVEGEEPGLAGEGGLAFTELASSDPEVTRQFLEKVFGWRFRAVQMPMGEYLAYESPGGRGGVRPVRSNEEPTSLAYIRVVDLDGAQRRVAATGGTIVLSRVDVPSMGSFFWFRVPGGPILACWQDLPARTEQKEVPK
ncbi:MAG: hypothetical protein WCA77_04150 [Thermoplasmata archaeon]